MTERHSEWVGLLRPDGPFIALPVLTSAFPQGLDTIPDDVMDKVRLAWAEVQAAPDLLNPGWCHLILADLLGYTPEALAEGGALPSDVRSGPSARLRPDAIAFGPDDRGGRAERMLIYRLPWETPLTRAGRDQASPAEQAADLCRHRSVPLALLTNGGMWALVHARPDETSTTAVFDADLWLEERDLLRAFASLLHTRRVLPPPRQRNGEHSASLAALFARSAEAQADVTSTLGIQVRRAVELLVGEMSRLDRESAGTVLHDVAPQNAYRGALTVMMRLVFLLYAEERRLMPVSAPLYESAYSVTGLYEQLGADQNLHSDEVGDRRAAAWPRLLATFAAVYGGCEHDEMRIPPYGGSLFDPARYPWLESLAVTDRVVREILGALLLLRRRGGAPERLSYKGLDVEQIGHVYEGLLELSCIRADEPYIGLTGKAEPELRLAAVEDAVRKGGAMIEWLAKECDASANAVRKALANANVDLADLHAASDNDTALTARIRPLSGLLRRDLRGLPTVYPAGSVIITKVGDRRATGTHYTPRPMAEEIVEHTLAPLCYSPGPADGADPTDWQVRPAGELLDLKVLDPAMGSGAFLVSACRYLAERLVQAWERDGYPDIILAALGPDYDRDDAILEAKRRVAARCLYGVDRDEAAIELGKLSLWLVTLAKNKPFSFLDHALRCGDSLIGLVNEAQVETFHLDPATGSRINARMTGAIDEVVGPILTQVRELRDEIESEPVRDAQQADALATKLRETEQLTTRLRDLANAVSAAALSTAGQSSDAFDDRLTSLAGDAQNLLTESESGSPLERAFRERLNTWLQGPRSTPIRPLHWPLEFPEVMQRGGFDAVTSNPPFMGGQKVTRQLGQDLRELLIQNVARGKRGSADLCSYFLLRNLSLTRRGRVGIIATNTIAQGDPREVGLDQAVDMGWAIYRAVKSQPWPGTASLEVSLVWVGHPSQSEIRILDGNQVAAITPALDPVSRVTGNPYRLAANTGRSFQGSNALGSGFILEPEQALTLIEKDGRNKEVLFPYLNGEDLNSRWDCSASRWVIYYRNWPLEQAQQYPLCFSIVERTVKPERAKNNDRRRRDLWWQFTRPTLDLYKTISGLDRVLVVAQTSTTQMPALVKNGQVFDQKLVVFADSSAAELAFRTSNIQYWWTVARGSTMRVDTVYTPSDCCDTLPAPTMSKVISTAGQALDEFRRNVMVARRIGLTALYNIVNDNRVRDSDIARLREIHLAIDEAILSAYALDEEREPSIRQFEAQVADGLLPAWRHIELGHGFHETRQGTRFTISPQARVDVLDKLLALNYYRYQQEVERGLHSGRGSVKRNGGSSSSEALGFDDGSMFKPEGALF